MTYPRKMLKALRQANRLRESMRLRVVGDRIGDSEMSSLHGRVQGLARAATTDKMMQVTHSNGTMEVV